MFTEFRRPRRHRTSTRRRSWTRWWTRQRSGMGT